ncbi:MAG: hypothetical protein H0A76_00170 [Candidatus Thiodubiliella endoseptemdiera]|uniref:Uncharacterized protein n=1 Tax=Candidatus Thiodubiliella endoseptemdiera TaxID=2738886 RepID=A0A853EYG2_9GAMM|nr:hypothetical protein [Candidatus Thiodubiliella endoseptemdiera]
MAPFKNYIKIQALLLTPAYEAKNGDDNPFNGIDVGIFPPTLADIEAMGF